MWPLVLALVAACLFFVLFNEALLALLCFLGAFSIALARFLKGTGKAAKGSAKALTKGMYAELEKADTAAHDSSMLEAGVKNAADIAGQQLYAPDKYQFRFKGIGAAGDSFQKLIDSFKKVFK